MSDPTYHVDPAFPDVVDDANTVRDVVDDPQLPALPGDDYEAVDFVGTTVEEQIEGESLDEKLAREVPEPGAGAEVRSADVDDAALATRERLLDDPEGGTVGRLVEPDEGSHTDTEPDAIAYEALGGQDDLSAEEAAMHIEPEA